MNDSGVQVLVTRAGLLLFLIKSALKYLHHLFLKPSYSYSHQIKNMSDVKKIMWVEDQEKKVHPSL